MTQSDRPIDEETERVASVVIGSALAVHSALGPGLSEHAYERALRLELKARGVRHSAQHLLSVVYRGEVIRAGRADLIVDGRVLVELKCVSRFDPVHVSQVVAYLRATGLRLGR